MKPTRHIVKPNIGFWKPKHSVWFKKNDDDIGDVCAHKFCAEEQRKSEVKRLGTDAGCEGYKRMGCYECEGKRKDCYAYTEQPRRSKK